MEQTQLQYALELLGSYGAGTLTYLILEASKYGKNFSISIFYNSNIKPLLYSILGGIVVIGVAAFLPQFIPFIEVQTGETLQLNYTGILFAGTVVGGIIKSMISNNKKAAKIN